jgi:hypothetical protein
MNISTKKILLQLSTWISCENMKCKWISSFQNECMQLYMKCKWISSSQNECMQIIYIWNASRFHLFKWNAFYLWIHAIIIISKLTGHFSSLIIAKLLFYINNKQLCPVCVRVPLVKKWWSLIFMKFICWFRIFK